MSQTELEPADPFILLAALTRYPNVNRMALELAVRGGKLTPISRFGRLWLLRTDAESWLSSDAPRGSRSHPRREFEL